MFPPTYRFKKGERHMGSYVYIKKKRSGDRINEPSFCDRVLWKSYPGSKIINTTYGMYTYAVSVTKAMSHYCNRMHTQCHHK